MITFITVFIEGFKARLLPIFNETTLAALREFKPWDYPSAAIAAGIGAVVASAILYAIGIWLRRMPEKVSTPEQKIRIENLRKIAMEWLPWLLILSPTPIGGILIIAAGFFNIPRITAGLAILAAEILWRVTPLL
jgi:membrane protein YqaA with SNARE-associated domain